MKKKTIVKHNSEEELRKIIKTTGDGRYRLRVQTILLAMEGKTAKEIREQLMISHYSVFNWLKRYNERGLQGLKEISKGGRKEGNPKWDKAIFEEMFKEIEKMEEYWSAPKIQKWIEQRFGVKIPVITIRYRLKKGGYSYKTSRPYPYKGDERAQAEFKKKG